MKLLDVINSPWAIVPEKLAEIRDIYCTHLRGEKIDLASIEAALGSPLVREPQGYEVVGTTAVINVDGPIAKRMNMFSRVSGGASSELIARDLRDAMDDPNVDSIVLSIDSPGGTVNGTQELARLVYGMRDGGKPIVAWTDGMMASAAYWIGAAADSIYISGDTTQVGSIGVVATHVDVSRAQEGMGVRTTEITAGRYKRIASNYAPLSESGRSYIQDQVDALYGAFVADVAEFRGISEEDVLGNMADGRVFIGRRAVEAGLVDGVSTLDGLITSLAGDGPLIQGAGAALDNEERGRLIAQLEQESEMDWNDISADTLREHRADLVTAIQSAATEQGAKAERERIAAVRAQAMSGHEELIERLSMDGTTTGPEAAVQVLQAERATQRADAEAIDRDGARIGVQPGAEEGAADDDQAALDALPVEDRCKLRWQREPNTRAEFGTVERFVAFELNRGRTRHVSRVA